jgi:hypothetical protein
MFRAFWIWDVSVFWKWVFWKVGPNSADVRELPCADGQSFTVTATRRKVESKEDAKPILAKPNQGEGEYGMREGTELKPVAVHARHPDWGRIGHEQFGHHELGP